MPCRTVLAATTLLATLSAAAHAKIVTEPIDYDHDGVALRGHLVYDDAVSGKRPGVLVVHEWWGRNAHAQKRAEMLAEAGYVAFALDMYGKGKLTDDPAQAGKWAGALYGDRDLLRARAAAGLDVLAKHGRVDATKLAAIGYCFGGTTVTELAYHGADVKAVVSFHGGLKVPTPDDAGRVVGRILICHGAADPMVKPETLTAVTTTLEAAGVDYQLIAYGGAVHSFTSKEADKRGIPGVAYQAAADHRSWRHMLDLFAETIGVYR